MDDDTKDDTKDGTEHATRKTKRVGERQPLNESPPSKDALGPGQLYRLSWYFYLFLAVAGVLWIGAREGRIALSLFIDLGAWWKDLGLGLAAGGVLLGVWSALRTWSRRARELERNIGRLLGPLEPAEVAGLALLSGFAEELLFRGAMQGSWGFAITTFVFAIVHTGPGPAYRFWTLFAAIAGVLLGGLMLWRGNLLAPVVAHMLVNGVNLMRLEAEVEESTAPEAAKEAAPEAAPEAGKTEPDPAAPEDPQRVATKLPQRLASLLD